MPPATKTSARFHGHPLRTPEGQAEQAAAFAPRWSGGAFADLSEPQIQRHPAFDRLMARMPAEVRQSLSSEQLLALSLASVPVNSVHAVDYRVSLPFFGKRFYLTVLAGPERRSLARLAGEGQLPSKQLAKLNPTAIGFVLAVAIFAAAMGLFIAKMAFGINLFEGGADAHAVLRALDSPAKF